MFGDFSPKLFNSVNKIKKPQFPPRKEVNAQKHIHTQRYTILQKQPQNGKSISAD